jgi:hypothetical protein
MTDSTDPEHRREGPRVERPTFRSRRMLDDDPITRELADLAEREEMLRRAAQRMLDEAERLRKQSERIMEGRSITTKLKPDGSLTRGAEPPAPPR